MKRILFIDRDGTLIKEAPPTYQIDSFEKLEFYPNMFEYMSRIAREFDYELLMVTNQSLSRINSQRPLTCQKLSGKRFVQLDKVDVCDLQFCLGKHLLDCGNRRDKDLFR